MYAAAGNPANLRVQFGAPAASLGYWGTNDRVQRLHVDGASGTSRGQVVAGCDVARMTGIWLGLGVEREPIRRHYRNSFEPMMLAKPLIFGSLAVMFLDCFWSGPRDRSRYTVTGFPEEV
jgi:hypothetical protein